MNSKRESQVEVVEEETLIQEEGVVDKEEEANIFPI